MHFWLLKKTPLNKFVLHGSALIQLYNQVTHLLLLGIFENAQKSLFFSQKRPHIMSWKCQYLSSQKRPLCRGNAPLKILFLLQRLDPDF